MGKLEDQNWRWVATWVWLKPGKLLIELVQTRRAAAISSEVNDVSFGPGQTGHRRHVVRLPELSPRRTFPAEFPAAQRRTGGGRCHQGHIRHSCAPWSAQAPTRINGEQSGCSHNSRQMPRWRLWTAILPVPDWAGPRATPEPPTWPRRRPGGLRWGAFGARVQARDKLTPSSGLTTTAGPSPRQEASPNTASGRHAVNGARWLDGRRTRGVALAHLSTAHLGQELAWAWAGAGPSYRWISTRNSMAIWDRTSGGWQYWWTLTLGGARA